MCVAYVVVGSVVALVSFVLSLINGATLLAALAVYSLSGGLTVLVLAAVQLCRTEGGERAVPSPTRSDEPLVKLRKHAFQLPPQTPGVSGQTEERTAKTRVRQRCTQS